MYMYMFCFLFASAFEKYRAYPACTCRKMSKLKQLVLLLFGFRLGALTFPTSSTRMSKLHSIVEYAKDIRTTVWSLRCQQAASTVADCVRRPSPVNNTSGTTRCMAHDLRAV